MRRAWLLVIFVFTMYLFSFYIYESRSYKVIPIDIIEKSGKTLREYQVKVDTKSLGIGPCEGYRALSEDNKILPSYCDGEILWIRVPMIPAKGMVRVYLQKGSGSSPRDVFDFYEDFSSCPNIVLVDWGYKKESGRTIWYPLVGSEVKWLRRNCLGKPRNDVSILCRGGYLKAFRPDQCGFQLILSTFFVPNGDVGFRIDARMGITTNWWDRDVSLGFFVLGKSYLSSSSLRERISFYHGMDGNVKKWKFGISRQFFLTYRTQNLAVKETSVGPGSLAKYSVVYYGNKLTGYYNDNAVVSSYIGRLNGELALFIGFNTDSWSPGRIDGITDWIRIRKYVYPEPQVTIGKEPEKVEEKKETTSKMITASYSKISDQSTTHTPEERTSPSFIETITITKEKTTTLTTAANTPQPLLENYGGEKESSMYLIVIFILIAVITVLLVIILRLKRTRGDGTMETQIYSFD